jgi:hypothetical protein
MDQTGHVQVIVVNSPTIVAPTRLINRQGVFSFVLHRRSRIVPIVTRPETTVLTLGILSPSIIVHDMIPHTRVVHEPRQEIRRVPIRTIGLPGSVTPLNRVHSVPPNRTVRRSACQ